MRRALVAAALVSGLLAAPPAWAHLPEGAASYAWVEPPSGLDVAERAVGRDVRVPPEFFSGGATDVWTPDLQATLTLRVSALPDDEVAVRLEPVGTSDLPPLPDGLLANGNGYRVDFDVEALPEATATVALAPPFAAVTVLRLDPGDRWTDLDASPRSDGLVVAPAADGVLLLPVTDRTDGHASALGAVVHDPARAGLLVVGLALLAAGVARVLRRRTSRASAGEPVSR